MVEQEVKPAIGALQAGSLTPAEMRSRATGWEARFRSARAELARVLVPTGLSSAAVGFDRAFQGYEAAVARLASISDQASGAGSATDVAATTAAAHQADSAYDQAAAVIQAQRRAAGLGPAIDLPDPSATAG